LELPELDKIQTIKELLCVKYGLVSLPLFDISEIDFMLESLCNYLSSIFTNFLSVLFVRFYIKYIKLNNKCTIPAGVVGSVDVDIVEV